MTATVTLNDFLKNRASLSAEPVAKTKVPPDKSGRIIASCPIKNAVTSPAAMA